MALPQDLIQLLALFGPADRDKILRWREAERGILTVPIEAGKPIQARVEVFGTWQVSIDLNNPRGILAAQCSCGAESLCPHVGLAWLLYLETDGPVEPGGEVSGLIQPQAGPEPTAAAAAGQKLATAWTRSWEESSEQEADRAAKPSQAASSYLPKAPSPPEPRLLHTQGLMNPLSDMDAPVPEDLRLYSPDEDPELKSKILEIYGAGPDPKGALGHEAEKTGAQDLHSLVSGKGGDSWRPVIVVEPGLDENGKPRANRLAGQLRLRLALAFNRKSGGLGRTKDWPSGGLAQGRLSNGELVLPPDPQDAPWIDVFLGQRGVMEPERLFLLAQAADAPALPKLMTRQGMELELVEAVSLDLCFQPELLPWTSKEVRYAGNLSFVLDDGPREVRAYQMGARWHCFLDTEGNLARMAADPRLARLLDALEVQNYQLPPQGVESLMALNQQQPIPGLTIRLQGRTVQKCLRRGQPVVYLEGDLGLKGMGQIFTVVHFEIDWDLDGVEPDWTRHLAVDPETAAATLWLRDLAWEARTLDWFKTMIGVSDGRAFSSQAPVYQPRMSGRYQAVPETGSIGQLQLLNEERHVRVRGSSEDFLRDWGAGLMEEGVAIALGKGGEASARGSVGIHVDRGMDWLDLEAVVEGIRGTGAPGSRARAQRKARTPDKERREELLAVQDLLRHRLVRTNRRVLLLNPHDARKLEALLAAGLEPGKKNRVSLGNIGALAALGGSELAPELADVPEIADARTLVARLSDMGALELQDNPPGFDAKLRGYQRVGYSWLRQMGKAGLGACLADDMGLGKTVMSLAHIQALKHETTVLQGRAFSALLVLPVSTLPNWQAEAARFAPGLGVAVHAGTERSKGTWPDFSSFCASTDLVLVSYATLRMDAELFQARVWDLVLIDEAQNIKNPESQTFQAVCGLQARQRIALTGTPVENSVQDLWSHMEFLNPGMLGSLKYFRARFGFAIEERRDEDTLATLRRMISPFMLRRRKESVALDLPPKEEVILYCELGPEQRKVYEDIKDSYRFKVDEAVRKHGVERSALTILEALLRLRQACLIPGVINPEWDGVGSAKMDLFCDILAELHSENHKALVFSQFVEVLQRLSRTVSAQGLDHVYLDGQTEKRGELIQRFQQEPDCSVFLLSLKAGGVGINLTAADYVILFDPWWNPAVESQAIDRAHRIGQERPVIVYRLIVRDTVEEKILDLQNRKKHLAGTLIGDDGVLLPGLSPQDLLDLLG